MTLSQERLLLGCAISASLLALAGYIISAEMRARHAEELRETANAPNWKDPPVLLKLREAAKNNPTSARAQAAYAKQLVREGNYNAETVGALDASIRLNPADAECYLMRGKVLEMTSGGEAAANSYEQAVAIDSNLTEAMIRRADIARNHSEWDSAIGWYVRALSVEPGNALAHNNLGMVLSRKGEYTQAIAEFEGALKYDPQNGSVMHNIGSVYKQLDDPRAALEWFERACHLSRPHQPSCREMRRLNPTR